ncbi:MAG: alpha/beta fold hydrolase [Candidatus Peribacteraceae bacterium]|nr:alpha/beta fold hydrolase [Candidatus Peribacteraceae bacterium]
MSYLQRPDARIYFEEHGRAESCLALTYGLAGSSRLWEPQIQALSSKCRLLLWDQRGHGRSSSPDDRSSYGPWVSVEDLHALLDHMGCERAIVGGQSMGGGVATRFTVRYPNRVAGLIVCNSHSASGLDSSADIRSMRQQSLWVLEQQGLEAFAEYAMAEDPNIRSRFIALPQERENVRRQLSEMFLALDVKGYVNSVIGIRQSDDLSDRLRSISAPTLLLSGEYDPSLPSMRFIHQEIRSSILHVLPGAGHHANLDQPEAFNQIILDFLHRHAGIMSS